MTRDKLGRFVRGTHSHKSTEIKQGQHLSKDTEIKQGQHLSKQTEFKRIYSDFERKKHRAEYGRFWRKNNKEKEKTHYLARNIKIPKNKLCEECKKNKAELKHHEDYSKPLEVKFICYKCHNKKITNRSKKAINLHLQRLKGEVIKLD